MTGNYFANFPCDPKQQLLPPTGQEPGNGIPTKLVMILEKCKTSTVYNIGSGISTSVRGIVEIVCKNFDFDYEIPQDDKSDISPTDFWADISKIKREIGWKPKTNINDGIEKTIQYYNKINL